MAGLILELQADALDRNVPVSDLLRKALVISKKLGVDEIAHWIDAEMNGYKDPAEIPPYREIRGEVKVWNPYHGWVPLQFGSAEQGEMYSRRKIGQSISQLDSLHDRQSGGQLQVPFSQSTVNRLMESMDVPLQPSLLVSPATIVGILHVVRNTLLNWSLELERKGVIGDGMTFSREEKSAAGQVTYQITNNIGSMHNSQLQQHSTSSTQTMTVGGDIQAVHELIVELRAAMTKMHLDAPSQQELVAELTTLEAQSASPKPKRGIIHESMKSVRTILEGAAGNVLAGDLVAKISLLLQSLS